MALHQDTGCARKIGICRLFRAFAASSVGALDHYEYRAVGDIVNTASRIDGLNKILGTRILVSTEVPHEPDGFLTRELGTFLLLGKAQPLVVHELMCCLEDASQQQRSLCGRFAEALEAYTRQAWGEAIERFSAISTSSLSEEDGPSLFYVELCERYKANPPRGSWTGVVRVMKNNHRCGLPLMWCWASNAIIQNIGARVLQLCNEQSGSAMQT